MSIVRMCRHDSSVCSAAAKYSFVDPAIFLSTQQAYRNAELPKKQAELAMTVEQKAKEAALVAKAKAEKEAAEQAEAARVALEQEKAEAERAAVEKAALEEAERERLGKHATVRIQRKDWYFPFT